MMAPVTWIFFALCIAPYFKCSETDTSACDAAESEYAQLVDNLKQAVTNGTDDIARIPDQNLIHDTVKAHSAVAALCEKFNATAEAVENVISQCPPTSLKCTQYRAMTIATDVLRDFAKLCKSVQAEDIQHFKTVAKCRTSLIQRWQQSNNTDASDWFHVSTWLNILHRKAAQRTVPCGLTCGRKCTCWMVQTEMPFPFQRPDGRIRDVCGQNVQDLVQMLQERAQNALNCSKFGDYGTGWAWLDANYRANQTSSALHH